MIRSSPVRCTSIRSWTSSRTATLEPPPGIWSSSPTKVPSCRIFSWNSFSLSTPLLHCAPQNENKAQQQTAETEGNPYLRAGLNRLLRNSCFVSGHDFSRAINDSKYDGLSAPEVLLSFTGGGRVAHISLVFCEMWDTTAFS